MNATLFCQPDGTVRGLYSEAVCLGLLGLLRVTRASSVEFDSTLQMWRVFDADGRSLFASESRETCLGWEQEFFNQQLEREG